MLIGINFKNHLFRITMFAYLRSNPEAITTTVATNMRDHCRNQRPLLTGLNPSNPTVAGILAEIYMREFACTLQTLKQVNQIASMYHEHAFDNTDAYIEGEGQGQRHRQLQTHEMTTEQRHASQLLLGVGNNYSEINVALKTLECSITMRHVMVCDAAVAGAVAKQFQNDPSLAEDAFDRLNHITKQVWSMVNMLAFSNLFRFADPAHPIRIANPEDSIFIPHIPMQQTPVYEPVYEEQEQEPEPKHEACNDCGKPVDTTKMHHRMGLNPTDAYLCHPCGFKREFPDEYREGFADEEDERSNKSEMNAQYQTHFNEIVEMLTDSKITTEQACTLFEELSDDVNNVSDS